MQQNLYLTSPIPCSVNHYMKPRPFLMNGKPQVTMYETADAKEYKRNFISYVRTAAKEQGFIMSDNKFRHYYVDCTFYFPRVDMDANNYWKLLFDAITELKCSQEQTDEKAFCPQCGNELKGQAIFCGKCGCRIG